MSLGIETAKEFIDYMYERVSDLRHNNTKDELTQIVLDVLRELQRSEYPELGIGIEVRKDELSPDILVTWGIEGLVLLNFSERKIDDEDKILFG